MTVAGFLMMPARAASLTALLAVAVAGAGDHDLVTIASWLVGSFDTRAQVERDRETDAVMADEVVSMTVRPIQDPVDFSDGLYLYVETRAAPGAGALRQRIFRLKKSGNRIRLEFLRIDGRVRELLAIDPQMLSQLASSDLTREGGCDVLLELQAGEFIGTSSPRSCKPERAGTSYSTMSLRVSKEAVVLLERGYDDKGVQTFGPTNGCGQEFRRPRQ